MVCWCSGFPSFLLFLYDYRSYIVYYTHMHSHVHVQYMCMCMYMCMEERTYSPACCSHRVDHTRRQGCRCQAHSLHRQHTAAGTSPVEQSYALGPSPHNCGRVTHQMYNACCKQSTMSVSLTYVHVSSKDLRNLKNALHNLGIPTMHDNSVCVYAIFYRLSHILAISKLRSPFYIYTCI